MKRGIAFGTVLALGLGALVWSERHPANVRANPEALLYFIADSEQEISRLPMSVTRLSDQEEIDVGNKLAANFSVDRYDTEPGPGRRRSIQTVSKYVSRVGYKVAARAHRKLPYKFHYIPSMEFVNAFALPGGHVYMGAGLISLMDSEDELAAVLGHEIEHIDHYHCAERVQTEVRLRRLPLAEVAELPIMLFQAGYGKDQELEADREGTQLAVWAGYSPQGAVRMFETFDRLYQEYVRKAESPQEEFSRVAVETLEGYFRSHPLPSERIEQIRKLINQNNWGNLNRERDLEVAYVFWTERAWRDYQAGHYDSAIRLAQHSLEMKPGQLEALRVLGQSQFYQANFAEAAATFRQELDLEPKDNQLIGLYVDALAAQHTPGESLRTFTAWSDSHPDLKSRLEVRMELARLSFAAEGQSAADRILFPTIAPNLDSLPPALRGRYGWWLYSAGRQEEAANVLLRAVRELPDDPFLQVDLGWVLIERHNLEDAIQRFETAASHYPTAGEESPSQRRRLSNERGIALAVAEWQAQQFDRAVGEFAGMSSNEPEWRNPRWVGALYTPGVAKTIEELKAEQRKRSGPRAHQSF